MDRSVAAARGGYDALVATYRQTVLTAFQQVKDALSDLRILQRQARTAAIAAKSAQRAVDVTFNTHRAGALPSATVTTGQSLLLVDQQTALSIEQSRFVASVALIETLGSGWSVRDLPGKPATFNPLLH